MEQIRAELVRLASQGDETAISELYQQTYKGTYRIIRTLIKDDDTALDILQDTFIKAFDSLDQLQEPERFQAWVNQIGANRAKDYLKKKRPVLFTEMENEDGEMREFSDECISHLPEAVLDREETARLLKEILDTLPEEQRAVLFMMHYEQMSIKEIAQALDCSENTVKSRLNYGRKKVKTAVEDLEKKGTKLYSLAPLPYFVWLLRTAKAQEIPATAFYSAADAATGIASQTVTQTIGSQSARKVTKFSAKAAAKIGTKTLSRKIVAGTLAVAVAGGAGAAVVNAIHGGEKENAAAHVIYEEFLSDYGNLLEASYDLVYADQERFWTEIDEAIWVQNPDTDPNVAQSWYLDYTPGEDFLAGVPVPETRYNPNMNKTWLLTTSRLAEEELRYACQDVDGDGVDEMFIGMFYQNELQTVQMDVYTVMDGKLCRGSVDFQFYGDRTEWELKPAQEAEYVGSQYTHNHDIVYISTGTKAFTPATVIPEPDCQWQTFCKYAK